MDKIFEVVKIIFIIISIILSIVAISLILIDLASAATSGRAVFEASNFSIIVDGNAPNIVILSPVNLIYSSPVFVNYSVFDHSLDSVWYSLNNGTNISISDNFYLNLSDGSYNLKIFANDSFGRINFSDAYFSVSGISEFCGDAICGASESCSNCAVDCGACSIANGQTGGGGTGGGNGKKEEKKNLTKIEENPEIIEKEETKNDSRTEFPQGDKRKSNLGLIILMFIVIILLAIIVTYYFYEKRHKKIFDKIKYEILQRSK